MTFLILSMIFIDTHCHLNFKAFNKDLDRVLQRAKSQGVNKIIIPGAKLDSSEKAVSIAKENPACFAAVGIHPHHAGEFENSLQLSEILTDLSKNKKVVAIGEIGLDYYRYKNYPQVSEKDKEIQKKLLLLQLDVAAKRDLPVIIHGRQSHDDLLQLLSSPFNNNNKISGVFHCFDGNKKHLQKALSLGFYIGFDGNCTYPENEELRKLIEITPLEKILLETDAPFLTPLPFRGSRNEPVFIKYVAENIAKIKKLEITTIAEITYRNAKNLFRI